MRLTRRTNLAMRILMFCAVNPGRTVTKAEIALSCNASENHIGQVVNHLAHQGYLHTIRGRGGGVTLNRAPGAITVGSVMRDFEAEVPLAECFAAADNTCPLSAVCRLKQEFCAALAAFYDHLEGVTLDDLVAGNSGLKEILSIPVAAE